MAKGSIPAAVAALVLLVTGRTAAQGVYVPVEETAKPRPFGVRLDGGWVDVGLVNLTKGKTGFLVGGHLSLGTLFAPWIDLSGGVRYWKADLERTENDDRVSGRVSNLAIHPDLRVHLFRWGWARPYLLAGPAIQFVGADIPDDRVLEDAVSGFKMGFDTGFGISSAGGRMRWHVGGRREFVEDVGNWSWVLGAGWWPDVHAARLPRTGFAPAPVTSPGATYPPGTTTPGAAATPGAPTPAGSGADADETITPMMRELMEQNEAMRAQMDSLRAEVDAQRAKTTPIPAPVSPPPAAEGPPPAVPKETSASPGLGTALERMAALSAMTHLTPTDEGWRLVLGGEFAFESGSSRLTVPAREEIRRLADVLLRFPSARTVVEGHSDSAGNPMQNLALSEERAAEVRNELILSGVDPGSIRARGLGSGLPVADNSTPEGRARNRRVEIRVIDPARAGTGDGR